MPEFVVCQNCGTRTQHFECDCCFEPAFPVITELQTDIPGEEEDPTNYEARRFQAARLMRVHRNLGRSSNRLLIQILTEAEAPKGVIEMARDLECSICERTKKIAPSRPANPLRAREVGEALALDFSYHVSSDNQRLMALNLIDEAAKFHVAKVVRQSKTARTFQD